MMWLKLEARLLWRSSIARWLFLAYALATLLTAGFGLQRLHQEQAQQAVVQAHYAQQLAQKGEQYGTQPGYMAYYLKVPAVFEPSPWSALIRGERDEHPSQRRIGMLALHEQLHRGDLLNHDLQQLGTLDLAFVWLYLLPLLIGILCVNALASERESGRWPLLGAQVSAARFIAQRLAVRLGAVVGVTLVLYVLVGIMVGVPLDRTWFAVLGLLLLYSLFWAALTTALIALRLSSVQNTLAYVGVWLLLGFLVPGLAYLSQMRGEDLDTGIALMLEQREAMHSSWDADKAADLQTFLEKYPEWSDTEPMVGRFDWKWYYAMQQMSDEHVAEEYQQLRQRRLAIPQDVRLWRWLSPVLNTQFALSRLARTDVVAHQRYQDNIVQWHNDMRQFWYPHLFFDIEFSSEMVDELPGLEQSDSAREAEVF